MREERGKKKAFFERKKELKHSFKERNQERKKKIALLEKKKEGKKEKSP